MNPNLSTLHEFTFFVLFFCGLFCTSHTNTIRAKRQISFDVNFTEEKVNEGETVADDTKNNESYLIVNILKSLGGELTESVEYGNGDDNNTQVVLKEIKVVWQRIVNNPELLVNSTESLESLRTYMAQILYLVNDRYCESPDETFFKGQCLPVSTRKRSEHCPENMGLYDDENNEGICDCLELIGDQAKSELGSIFSDDTGVCHQQHTQGPCSYGQWFVFKNTPQCEPAPEGCPTDGRHVYWNPDPSMAKKCWEIWSQGPCEEGQLIHLAQDKEELQVFCSHRLAEHYISGSLSIPKCPKGSWRSRNGRCNKAHFG
ncbi:uncharacterized protein LOC124198044 [Daphnia pulex]|uniref:uncharacterized protein LOC124198044 n=1 Tax=Daphnia pulex TaxID=6669 RepID=UPI001EDD4220|nr:uncharacterized protein LOC124198044 [Daphnia pulex]